MGKSNMRRLYMWVTLDKYELPLFVADSPAELSEVCGARPKTIYEMASLYSHGKIPRTQYVRVEVEPWT